MVPRPLGPARRFFQRLFRPQANARLRDTVAVLRAVGPLGTLSGAALNDLAEVVHPRRYRAGETLYMEQDPALGLYVVQEGLVRLLTEPEPGQVVDLGTVGPHGLFGELALLGGGDLRRLETARAAIDTRVLGLFLPDLKTLHRRHPKTAAAFMEALARDLAERHAALAHRLVERDGRAAGLRLFFNAPDPQTP